MQGITFSRQRPAVGGSGDGESLARHYRSSGYQVDILPATRSASAFAPDAILLLSRGAEQILVHAYGMRHGALTQGAVQRLVDERFDAGVTRAILLARAGFTVAAYQAALQHGDLVLADHPAGSDQPQEIPDVYAERAAARALSLREATRPAWPLRAAIGTGAVAMAVVCMFVSSPALQSRAERLLQRPASPAMAVAQVVDPMWTAPAQSRSSALQLAPVAEQVGGPVAQAQAASFGALPANFNQASAPRL